MRGWRHCSDQKGFVQHEYELYFQRLTIHIDRGKWYLREELQQPAFGEPESFDEPPLIATGAHFIEDERACIVSYLHHGIW